MRDGGCPCEGCAWDSGASRAGRQAGRQAALDPPTLRAASALGTHQEQQAGPDEGGHGHAWQAGAGRLCVRGGAAALGSHPRQAQQRRQHPRQQPPRQAGMDAEPGRPHPGPREGCQAELGDREEGSHAQRHKGGAQEAAGRHPAWRLMQRGLERAPGGVLAAWRHQVGRRDLGHGAGRLLVNQNALLAWQRGLTRNLAPRRARAGLIQRADPGRRRRQGGRWAAAAALARWGSWQQTTNYDDTDPRQHNRKLRGSNQRRFCNCNAATERRGLGAAAAGAARHRPTRQGVCAAAADSAAWALATSPECGSPPCCKASSRCRQQAHVQISSTAAHYKNWTQAAGQPQPQPQPQPRATSCAPPPHYSLVGDPPPHTSPPSCPPSAPSTPSGCAPARSRTTPQTCPPSGP